MNLYKVLFVVALIAASLAAARPAFELPGVFRAWYLTLLAVGLPWGLFLIRFVILADEDPRAALKDRTLAWLSWSPSLLVLGLLVSYRELGLEPEVGLTPAGGYLVIFTPLLILIKVYIKLIL